MKSLKINLFYNILLNISRVVFPIITAPYVTRVLSPDDLGLVNFGTSFTNYFSFVAMLGIPLYGARQIAKVREDKKSINRLLSELFSISVLNVVLISVIYVIIISFFEKFQSDYLVFLLLGITLYCTPLNIDWFYSGLENFKFITIRSLIIKIASVIALFVFVRTKDDLLLYVLISIFSTILSDIWNFVKLYNLGFKPKFVFGGLSRHIKPLLVLFASTMAATIYTLLDSVMLGFLSAYSEVAFYTYAMQISKSFLAAITSLSAVAVPRISFYMNSKQYEEINVLINKSFSLISFLSIPMCIGLIVISPTLIPLFLGSAFEGAVIPLQILSTLLILIGFNNISAIQCLVGLGKDNLFLYSILSGTFTNFILNLILIPSYGAIGASIASMVAEFCVLLLSLWFVHKYSQVKIAIVKEVINSVLVASLFFVAFYFLREFFVGWWLTIIFIVTCFIIYSSIQYYFQNQTLLLLLSIINKKKYHA